MGKIVLRKKFILFLTNFKNKIVFFFLTNFKNKIVFFFLTNFKSKMKMKMKINSKRYLSYLYFVVGNQLFF